MEELSLREKNLLHRIFKLSRENSNLEALNKALLERNALLTSELEKLKEEKRCNMWLRRIALQWKVTQEEALERIFSSH